MRIKPVSPLIAILYFLACNTSASTESPADPIIEDTIVLRKNDSGVRTIHVFVALCDNKYQGIVPVPASLGNGQDENKNLYWGAGFGVKTFFTRKTTMWKLVSSFPSPEKYIRERLLFKHVSKNVYLLADAYDGQFIQQATIDFLKASAGDGHLTIKNENKEIYFGGASNLITYTGHDGLMDFSLSQTFKAKNNSKRETIILACYSKKFFSPHLRSTGATPLLWSTGLMAPEAYILHDAVNEWINNSSAAQVRTAGAKAYARYQHCTTSAAMRLLVTGW
ncbi:MAG TPA: hypothetical protein VFZ42_10465 [Chitinophagaceae bacterium]